jgi:hypothetical protein
MTTFSKNVTVNAEVDVTISVDEFYNEMGYSEKDEMYDLLKDEFGTIDEDDIEENTMMGKDFLNALNILARNRHLLTVFEEDSIKALSERFKFL